MASEDRRYRGLLVDYGGVLTSNLFDSFRAFCEQEGIAPDEIGRRFREDRSARQLLIDLETGKLPEQEFEPQFARFRRSCLSTCRHRSARAFQVWEAPPD